MKNRGALSGITVVDLSRLLPGPYCSMILADHGARVISIEDKRFLADGLFMDIVNRNKEHMTLNLKTVEGRQIFFRLAEKADIVLEGFRPGVVDRLGVDYESVRKINPRIVYCSISGFGQTGPYRNRVGHDVNYLSIGGVLDLIGEPDRPPAIPGIQLADIAGGGMNAAIGILLALFAREKSGQGQYVDISMTDGMVGFLPAAMFFSRLTGSEPVRSDNILSHRYACYNTYETADGKYLSIGAVEKRFWQKLCKILEIQNYADLQYDDRHRTEIIDCLRRTFRQKTLAEWEGVLGASDVCWARVQSLGDVLNDPLFRAREMVVELETRSGRKSKTLGVPVKMSDTPGSVRTPPPEFGQDTAAILKELGYTDEEIGVLEEREVI
jgi:crotonobetainyl-CoA:carnitine CoA-transferase CaiB-like acyl-CoA transferase